MAEDRPYTVAGAAEKLSREEDDNWPYERPRPRTRSFVYFVQAQSGGLIKIGIATYPIKRMRDMQSGYPVILKIIGCIKGSYKEEGEIHHRFAAERRHCEWFEPSNALLGFIEETLYHKGISAEEYDDAGNSR